ncbi:glycosyltransferase, partial [Candidatus Saccharibacteria bacterium]|nr:glycosyltransferase [Candidatus Saccharibacteria bacterium]
MSRLLSTFNPADTLVYSRELFGAWIAVRKRFQVVFEAHDLPTSWLSRQLYKQLFTAQTFCRLVVISQALRELFAARNLLPEVNKVLVAHDAAEPIPPNTGDANGLLQDNGKTRLGYIGHLYSGRGIDLLLDIASRLDSFELHIIGGTNKDLVYWQNNHVPQNVYFHGFVHPGKLPHFFTAFDILLMPYQKSVSVAGGRTDTARWMSPLKMFEYMSTGKPIVSSDLPVLREVLVHEENALLV